MAATTNLMNSILFCLHKTSTKNVEITFSNPPKCHKNSSPFLSQQQCKKAWCVFTSFSGFHDFFGAKFVVGLWTAFTRLKRAASEGRYVCSL